MSRAQVETLTKLEAWRAYQRAFHYFSERVRSLQALTTYPHSNREAIESTLVQVEKSRLIYDLCRDRMARHFMPSSRRSFMPSRDARDATSERVRNIAELLWESAGRPEGTANEDWLRAEEIVRQAGETAHGAATAA